MTNIKLTKWVYYSGHKYRAPSIILRDEDESNVLSIIRHHDGTISFCEECDSYFSVWMPKDDAILTLKEAIAWIEGSL